MRSDPFGRAGHGAPRARGGGVRWWVIVVFAIYAGWYWLSNQQEAAFTGRSQLIDSDVQQEAALGLQAYDEILAQSRLVTAGPQAQAVADVARRLVERAPQVEATLAAEKGIRPTTQWDAFDWQVSLIDAEQANAFCLPGGKIAVYTGLLPITRTDDALAVVMGHEIAHALLRHGAERMAQQKLVQIGSVAAGAAVGDMDPQRRQMVLAALGAGAQFGFTLPFSRDHETEADDVGLMLAAAACFDPRQAIPLWERMAEAGGASPPEFASTHPNPGTRIQRLQALMPQALALRASYCGSTSSP